MCLTHSIRLLTKSIESAELEKLRAMQHSDVEAMKVAQRIDEMRTELHKLKALVQMFDTDTEHGTTVNETYIVKP